jgi:hypothetical protein
MSCAVVPSCLYTCAYVSVSGVILLLRKRDETHRARTHDPHRAKVKASKAQNQHQKIKGLEEV